MQLARNETPQLARNSNGLVRVLCITLAEIDLSLHLNASLILKTRQC